MTQGIDREANARLWQLSWWCLFVGSCFDGTGCGTFQRDETLSDLAFDILDFHVRIKWQSLARLHRSNMCNTHSKNQPSQHCPFNRIPISQMVRMQGGEAQMSGNQGISEGEGGRDGKEETRRQNGSVCRQKQIDRKPNSLLVFGDIRTFKP